MDVYFVRHGQTDGNVARRHQHHDTPLNATGKAQIAEVAPKIAALDPTHVFSSTQLRAVESTRIIMSCCVDVIPVTDSIFEEWHRPSILVAERYMGVKALWFIWCWFRGDKVENGESYQDFVDRVTKARSHLEAFDQDARVVIVSHAIFINIFLQHLRSKKPMNIFAAFKCLAKIYFMKNAKITHLRYLKDATGVGEWKIVKD